MAYLPWHVWPAQPAPMDRHQHDQLATLLRPVPLNPGNAASLKRLIFEAQTLICSEVKNKAGKREDSSHVSFATPERDARIVQQRNRLTGLRFKGEEECSHVSYDLVLAVLEKDCLTYLGPEKFPTRRNELMQKKPSKEISIDQSQLVVKDRTYLSDCHRAGNCQRLQTSGLGLCSQTGVCRECIQRSGDNRYSLFSRRVYT